MKKLVAVALATSALSMARAAEGSPQESKVSELGTVESVHQVPVRELLPNVFEHSLKPSTAGEVVVRVDDGREIVLREGGTQRFVAGDRVRLRSSSHGLRVEHH